MSEGDAVLLCSARWLARQRAVSDQSKNCAAESLSTHAESTGRPRETIEFMRDHTPAGSAQGGRTHCMPVCSKRKGTHGSCPVLGGGTQRQAIRQPSNLCEQHHAALAARSTAPRQSRREEHRQCTSLPPVPDKVTPPCALHCACGAYVRRLARRGKECVLFFSWVFKLCSSRKLSCWHSHATGARTRTHQPRHQRTHTRARVRAKEEPRSKRVRHRC
jgi:hypothetical protein